VKNVFHSYSDVKNAQGVKRDTFSLRHGI